MAIGDKLFIADKATLDIVKTNTESIQTSQTKTNQMADYDVNLYPVAVRDTGYSSAVGGQWTEIVSISGEGLLLGASVISNSQATGNIRVEVDGVIVFESWVGYYGGYYASGIETPYFSLGYDSSLYGYNLPYISTASGSSPYGRKIIRHMPIKFNTSCVVKIKKYSGVEEASINGNYYIVTK